MKVKNNYQSHLGFGTERILPGEAAVLPRGYSLNHPIVKFYVAKGWLEVVGNVGTAVDVEQSVVGNVGTAVDVEQSVDVKVDVGGAGVDIKKSPTPISESGVGETAESDPKQKRIDKTKTTQTVSN